MGTKPQHSMMYRFLPPFLKEMREATEGNKLEVSGDMKIVYLDKQDADL